MRYRACATQHCISHYVVNGRRHHPEYKYVNLTARWADLGFDDSEEATVRDIYARKDLGTFAGEANHPWPLHGARSGWNEGQAAFVIPHAVTCCAGSLQEVRLQRPKLAAEAAGKHGAL